ncbi:MAG: DsbA family protein [Hyphomicrobiales bacterium]|nr:MAG: DsbA family protein [Hyphomicrobiales bacterium]
MRTLIRNDARSIARTSVLLAAGAAMLAIAGCSGEETASTNVVSTAQAQETTPAAPAATPVPGAATSPAATPAAPAATPAAGETAAVEGPAPQGTVDVAKLMAPGSLPDVVIGDANAPVTIVEYASMTCSHCADFAVNIWPTVKKDYIDTGKAKLILREFPFDPRAVAAFMLARCAPDDRRTAMVDVLFHQQEQWARAQNASEALLGIAKLAGFTQETFAACLNDKALQAKVVEMQKRGETDFGVKATPTFFINGAKYPGAMSAAEFGAIIAAAK